ncbi:hypothetical protein SAMN04488693_107176 [Arthrobacter subterraneus]|uniref:Uncharacterized protein n=1 Tax=Arthrobacter subterraneus TaxID=335973 RepID=A0A1G8IVN1_9MICC|nr:hypothetical protein SAMN04488693_107176 [Arthrobacter subterraneus]
MLLCDTRVALHWLRAEGFKLRVRHRVLEAWLSFHVKPYGPLTPLLPVGRTALRNLATYTGAVGHPTAAWSLTL